MQWSKEWRGRNEQDTWTAGFVELVEAETEMGIGVLKRLNGRGVGKDVYEGWWCGSAQAGDEQQREWLDWWACAPRTKVYDLYIPTYLSRENTCRVPDGVSALMAAWGNGLFLKS
jgi:hypothetical protein